MNRLYIIGNLCGDPEHRVTPNGIDVASFTVATKSKFRKDANGNLVTDFFRISAWRALADVCCRYLVKGSKVAIIGEAQPRIYTKKDGTTVPQIEMNADEIEFLSPREDRREEPAPYRPQTRSEAYDREQREQAKRYAEDAQFVEINDGDLPF